MDEKDFDSSGAGKTAAKGARREIAVYTAIIWCIAAALAVLLLLPLKSLAEKDREFKTPKDNPKCERVLRVVANSDSPPYSFISRKGNAAGFDVEMIYAAAEILGANVRLDMVPWQACLEGFQSGKYQLLLTAPYTEAAAEEQNLFFSQALTAGNYAIFGERGEDFSFARFTKSAIAFVSDDWAVDDFRRTLNLTQRFVFYPSYSDCFRALQKGECDYVIAPKDTGERILERLGMAGFSATVNTICHGRRCIAAMPENAALIEEINGALEELRKTGGWRKAGDKWLVAPYRWTDLDWYRAISAELALAALLAVFLVLRGVARKGS